MSLELVTPPLSEPVSLEEAKAHLRVDADDENGLIARLIAAARGFAESHTGRAFITRELRLWRDCWPNNPQRGLELPWPPLSTVSAVVAYDRSDTATTLSSDAYIVDGAAAPARIVLRATTLLPAPLREANAIAVTYEAGYGFEAKDVPAGLRSAMLALIAHWYERRGDEPGSIPSLVLAQLAPFRVVLL